MLHLSKALPTAGALLLIASTASAQITTYGQDYESLDMMDGAALANDNWDIFANVFDAGGGYLYGYGVFDAPNGGAGFSAVATGSAGPDQGVQYMNIYSDYNNVDQGTGSYVEANVFQEDSVVAGDVGNTWTFSFDYLKSPNVVNGDGDTTTNAFIKVIKVSDSSFATIYLDTFDTTGASTSTWASHTMDVLIDPAFAGEVIQFGFSSYCTAFNDSGRFYDNVAFELTTGMGPSLTPYSQDFEAMDMADPDALTLDAWKVFANIFDPMGGYLYGYGTFDAPNGTPGFSSVASGDGGPFQMTQYMNAYSDYNNTGEHTNGNLVNALVFQEQVVGSSNIGETWRFRFDHRKNPTSVNGDGTATTEAFVKVLKSSDGSFAELFLAEFDSTSVSDLAWGSMALDVLIDPAYAGELLQFGFSSLATNFDDTGRYYDNLDFNVVTPGLGEVVCLGNPTSTGLAAELLVTGSDVAADNDITLTVNNLRINALGYFITSTAPFTVYNPNGSDGHLCIAGSAIGRFAGNILNAGMTGTVSFSPDLTALPAAMGTIGTMAGDTRLFQYWSRDVVMGTATSTFSGAAAVTFN